MPVRTVCARRMSRGRRTRRPGSCRVDPSHTSGDTNEPSIDRRPRDLEGRVTAHGTRADDAVPLDGPGHRRRLTARGSTKGVAMAREEIERLDDEGMAAWDGHDAQAFADLFAAGFTVKTVAVPGPTTTKDGGREDAQGWVTAFPDMSGKQMNRGGSD